MNIDSCSVLSAQLNTHPQARAFLSHPFAFSAFAHSLMQSQIRPFPFPVPWSSQRNRPSFAALGSSCEVRAYPTITGEMPRSAYSRSDTPSHVGLDIGYVSNARISTVEALTVKCRVLTSSVFLQSPAGWRAPTTPRSHNHDAGCPSHPVDIPRTIYGRG